MSSVRTDKRSPESKFWLGGGPYLLFAALSALFLPEVVFQGKVFVGNTDRVASEIPFLHLASQALRHGSLPLWNSFSFCGYMGLGQHVLRLFYPPNLLIALLFPDSLPAATSWRIVFDLLLQMVLYYWLFLKVCEDRALAALSSLMVSLTTANASWISGGHNPNVFMAPILGLLWDWQRRSMRQNVLWLALALFLQLACGYHQLTAYGLVFAFAVSVIRCLGDGGPAGRPLLRLALLWGAALSLASMLDALEIIPFLRAQSLSNRTLMSYGDLVGMWGQPWYLALRTALPHFLGGYADFALVEGNGWINFGEAFPVYTGAAAFLSCALALRKPLRRDTLPWILAAAFLALCSLRTPFLAVPYLAFGRMPLVHGRLYMLLPVCLACLATAGLRLFLRGTPEFRRGCLRQTFAVVLVVALLASGVLGSPLSLASWLPADSWRVSTPGGVPSRLREAALLFAVGGGAFFLAMALHLGRRISEGAFKWCCVALIAADLLWSARHYTLPKEFTQDSAWYRPTPATRFLQALPDKDRYRFSLVRGAALTDTPALGFFNPSVNIPYGLPEVGGYATFIDRRYSLLLGKGRATDFRVTPAHAVDTPKMADLFAAKYFAVPDSPDSLALYAGFTRPVFAAPSVRILEKPDALARFRLACRVAPTPAGARDFVEAIHSKDVDLSETVFLDPADPLKGDWTRCRQNPADGLKMEEPRPGWLRGRASLRAPAWLVLSESFDPGWRAIVDGRPARIRRANFNFQAVELPAGESTVEFRYRFEHFGLGVFCVAVAGLALASLAIGPWLLRRALGGSRDCLD